FFSTTQCGQLIPCSTFLKKNQLINNLLQKSEIFQIYLKKGHHKYNFSQSLKVNKGSMLILSHNDTGRIGLTEFNNSMNHTDFIIMLGQNNLLSAFNTNSRFLINCLINSGNYMDTFKFNKTYPFFNIFLLKLKYSFSDIGIKKSVIIDPEASLVGDSIYFYNKSDKVESKFTNSTCFWQHIDDFRDLVDKNCSLAIKIDLKITSDDIHNLSFPAKYFRSEIIKITMKLDLFFIQRHSIKRSWEIFKQVDSTTFSNSSINFFNPTLNTSQIILPSNFLEYGVYKLVHKIRITILTGGIYDVSKESLLETYIEIVPGGVAVFSLENGLDYLKIGKNQSLELNPLKYAYDMDKLTDTSLLDFKFYCFLSDKDETDFGKKIEIISVVQDIFTIKNSGLNKSECFINTSKIHLNSNGKVLTINQSGLTFRENQSYIFLTTCLHYGKMYHQVVRVEVLNLLVLPQVSIKCRLQDLCKKYLTYTKINPSYPLVMESTCTAGCSNAVQINFLNKIFYRHENETKWTSLNNYIARKITYGETEYEFTILEKLFDIFSNIVYWRIVFNVNAFFLDGEIATGYNALNIKINEKPYNGTCKITPNIGYALSDKFVIDCIDWTDNDGYVVRYEYFVRNSKESSPIAINYNQNGTLITKLPQGLKENSYKLFVFVQVIDDSDGITIYEIPQIITVELMSGFLNDFSNQILNNPEQSNFLNDIKNGNLQDSSSSLISINSLINNEENSSNLLVEKQKLKNILIDIACNFQITDLSSVKVIASVLSVLTENPQDVSDSRNVKSMNMVHALTDKLLNLSSSSGFAFLKQAANKIVETAANNLLSVNSKNSTINLFEFFESINILLNKLVEISSQHLSLNQETQIKSNNIDFKITRLESIKMKNKLLKLESGEIKLPERKDSGIFMIKTFSLPKILKSNDQSLRESPMISMSYFNQNSELKVTDTLFEIKIKIDKNNEPEFIFFNSSLMNFSNFTSNQNSICFTTQLYNANSSFNLHLKPLNEVKAYIILIKFNEIPSFTKKIYDLVYFMCQSELIEDNNNTYYHVYMNLSIISKFFKSNKIIGFEISEINNELNLEYCFNSSFEKNELPENFKPQITSDFMYRVFSTGCYYFDPIKKEWTSDGMELQNNRSGFKEINCISTHLTDFTGGFFVLPSKIDFKSVFSKSSFIENPTIYLTVIITCSLYIIFSIVCIYFDKQDKIKTNVYVMKNNQPNYFYEICVFTGSRKDAGTKSNVFLDLYGSNFNSSIRELKSNNEKENEKILKRSSVDTFIMGVSKNLGDLSMCRIFHDNSGKTISDASWYLKHLIVTDLKMNKKYFFICEKWFRFDNEDAQIDRNINLAGEEESKQLAYLIKRQTKDRLSDGHLWFSIIARPTLSTFTRLDRLTCGFVLLFISMLGNILYYEADKTPKSEGIKIGPLSLSIHQIGIGIMSNLICFPPSFLLIQLFRRSKSRKSRTEKLKQTIKIASESKDLIDFSSKKKKPFEFPWWCKIVAYVLSLLFSGVSLFFIIIKGIEFGDEKVTKWLTSFIVSIFTSFFLTQPIQVAAITFILVLLYRKADNFTNFENSDNEKIKEEEEETKDPNYEESSKIINLNYTEKTNICQEKKKIFSNEKKAKSILREIICYSIFLVILFLVSYLNKDLNSYGYKNNLNNVFRINKKSMESVNKVESIYEWINFYFIPAFNSNIFSDNVSIVIGQPIMRQLRVQPIKGPNFVYDKFCFSEYSLLNHDKERFGSNLTGKFNESFIHKSSNLLNSYPYIGLFTYYYGGGYVYDQFLKMNQTKQDLLNLQKLCWIDEQTRAIFIEFSLYNVNLNLFSYCTILFEILPTGNILRSSKFEPVILYEAESSIKYFLVIVNVFYFIFILFFMIKEIRSIIKIRSKYFTMIWNYVEWIIFVISFAILAIYLYRQYAKEDLFKKIKENNKSFIRLQLLSYWNDVLGTLLGFLSFFGTLKFLKLLRTNRNIQMLMKTIRSCLNDLIQFSIVFGIVWISFVQLIYLIENDKTSDFSTLVKTLETTFTMILNNIPLTIYSGENYFFKTFICLTFYLILVFIMLNMFITLITENYEKARNKIIQSESEDILSNFLLRKILKLPNVFKKENVNYIEEPKNIKNNLELMDVTFIKLSDQIKQMF
ncbi:unnamed protein product, partial [Brachionus calyciflorus]